MYDKVNYRVVFMGIIKFDFMDCKIFVFIINCVVVNVKIFDLYFNVFCGIMILRKKIS